MNLRNIVKIGTVLSVLLFVLAVLFYVFTRLDMAKSNRDIDLFSLVPSNSIAVLESDNINTFFNLAVSAMGGALNEVITIFSAIVGIIHYLRAKRAGKPLEP